MISLSKSRLSNAECLRSFYHRYVTKKYKETFDESTTHGISRHKQVENYILAGDFLEEGYLRQQVDLILARANDAGCRLIVEESFGMTREYLPCSPTNWSKCWLRASPDLAVLNDDKVLYVDFKTGKPRENELQYLCNFLVMKAHYPEIKVMKATSIWENHGVTDDPSIYSEVMLQSYKEQLEALATPIEQAEQSNEWTPSPSKWTCMFCPGKPLNGGDCAFADTSPHYK